MYCSLKTKNEAIEALRNYSGANPYLLTLKRDAFLLNKSNIFTDFVVDYIIKNKDFTPKKIGKTVNIVDWYGEKLKTEYDIEFIPKKLLILVMLGETETTFHCIVKYRQNMEPMQLFIPKKGIIENFLVEDYHNIQVDFERYDRLASLNGVNRVLMPHQQDAVKFLLSRKKCILADDMGLGKMEPISSIIPTESGFKTFGELCVGDNVFGEDGKLHPITKIFEHTNKEIYKVTFSDGTYSYCGLDHLWKVRTKNMSTRKHGWVVKSLKELIDSNLQYNCQNRLKYGWSPLVNKYQIPVCESVQYSEKKYLIHPYVLGMCIGDGNLCNNGIYISIPDIEEENAVRISSLLQENMMLKKDTSTNCPRYRIIHKKRQFRNDYISEIKRLGLNVKGNDKFIPLEYKVGSVSQRLDLLRGLMDSDGTIGKNNRISFTTNSKQLANDVAELVFSLGGIARIGEYNHKGKKNLEYHVRIQIKNNPFYLTRKREKYHPTFKKYCSKYIVSAEYDRNEDARCIMVDYDEHTYLTGKNYIVTHNTTSLTISAMEGNFDSILIICPASLKTNWLDELKFYVPEREITIIDSINDKTKTELEKFLGYAEGKSGLTVKELRLEALKRGKWSENKYVILNFDILDEFYEIPKTRSKANIENAFENSPLLQFIKDKKSCLIIDEAHRLSNSKSQRYKIINDLIKRGNPECIFLSTGTPVTNNPQNLYCLLKLIGEPITDDWNYYMDRYCGGMKIPAKGEKEKWTSYFLKYVKKNSYYDLNSEERDRLKEYIKTHARMITISKDATNLDELKGKVSHVYLRRTKEDLNHNLPPKTIHEVYYEFTPEQALEYSNLWEEYETAQLEADPTKEINKDLLEGAIYRSYCSNQMVPNTIKLVNSFIAKGEKVIIATCYDEELYKLKEYYGNKCVVYNGKMSLKQKDFAKDEFINNPEKMVFIGNIQAASVGLTLIVSHILVFNCFAWTYIDNAQYEDRIYRIGQTKPCHIYYQYFKNTQYEHMWNIVLRKETIFNNLIVTENQK